MCGSTRGSGGYDGMMNEAAAVTIERAFRRPAWRWRLWSVARQQPLGTVSAVVIAISVILAPQANRVIRGVTLSLRRQQFVEAARAIGAGHARILIRHLLPNVAAPIIVLASVVMANAIIVEASLGFLGLGVQPP